MTRAARTPVLIVGGGPVGLSLGLDLASRGIGVTIVESRNGNEPSSARCNQISARSMEIFRRLGLSEELRERGLPPFHPTDAVSRTTATGIELSRVSLPARAERDVVTDGPDAHWPTPEHTHRINQQFFEPVLARAAASHPLIQVIHETTVEAFTQSNQGVTATLRNLQNGAASEIGSAYLVGCDGAKSMVRKSIGAELTGKPAIQLVQSTHICAPGLTDLMAGRPAWIYSFLNPRHCGTMIAIDGRENWQIHNFLYRGETDFGAVDRDRSIRDMLGVSPEFQYEVVSQADWVGRRLVSTKFRDRRVFICGDAAHLWLPHGGYGMNAGIADAATLAWMLAGVINGWADPGILDAYEAERQPITNQASDFITEIADRIIHQRRTIPDHIEADTSSAAAARARVGAEAYDIDVTQQSCGGLNFGYFYDHSPIIAYDDGVQPSYTMHRFTESTVPGCRVPHLWLGERRSLFDMLGPDYTLIRTDPDIEVTGMVNAATARGVPLKVLDVDRSEATDAYRQNLVLVRPDQHVAWRGDEAPAKPVELIDLISGRRVRSTSATRPMRNCMKAA